MPVAADDLELTVCGDGTSKDGDAASGYSGSAGDAMWLWAAVALGGVPGLAEADFGPDCVDEECPHECWGHGTCNKGPNPTPDKFCQSY